MCFKVSWAANIRTRTVAKFVTSLIFIIMLFGMGNPASAHGYLLRAIPEDRAILERAPIRLQYWFSEDLEPTFSSLKLRDQTGQVIAEGSVSPDNEALLTLRVPPDLPDGAYIVELRPAFASDGHAVAESRVFFVGSEIGGFNSKAANGRAAPLEILWRTITLTSTMLLFGLFSLYAGVLVPAWGSANYPAGLLPPRVMTRLSWMVGLALLVCFSGNILALIQQTMTFFNVNFINALNENLWSVVRIGSRFGDVWNIRMLFLVIVAGMFAAALYFRDEQPETVRAFWTANAWMMALVIGTWSVVSHAAGSQVLPWLGIAVDWLHGIGVGFWVGGLAALVLVLPIALKPYSDDQRRLALLAALRRFSRFAAASVVIVIASGLYSASNWIYTPSELTETRFGGALLLKLLLVGGLLLLGALHHIALHPARYARFSGLTTSIGQFATTLRLEVLLAVGVLIAVGQLSATPVPAPQITGQEAAAPTAIQQINGLEVTLTLTPGGPGINTYDTLITRDGQPVDDLDVRLRMIHPSEDWRSPLEEAEFVDSGLYVTAGAEIDAPGEWWSQINIIDNEMTYRLAFDWDIDAQAAVIQSRLPSPVTVAALLGVLAAVGGVIYPSIQAFYRKLNLNAANVTLVIGAIVASLIFVIGGFVTLQQTQLGYRADINPPPQIINTVLPDQVSLQRGQNLYESSCNGWQSAPDLDALRQRLPTVRDEDLFAAVRDGWRSLPPCREDLSENERWDIVNYLRTLEPIA